MSEFKFACPICGQHITADSKDTGSQIACPTCFRKIVVPQAPASDESKLVVSTSEVNKPRPPQTNPQLGSFETTPKKSVFPAGLVFVLVLACGAAALFLLRNKLHPQNAGKKANGNKGLQFSNSFTNYQGPSRWTLELTNITIPETIASGEIHGKAFTVERATLSGGNLVLRMGHSGPIELGLNIYFFSRQPEELSGKSAEVKATERVAPRVVLRWVESQRESRTFHNGYAMKIEFGSVSNNALPGRIFLATPDEAKSWIAGTFRAEIHKPSPPKRRPPVEHPTQ